MNASAGAIKPKLSGTAIEVGHVVCGYDLDTPVLRDISLRVRRGEMIGILGPNGAGKTTLFRLLAGLIRPRSGCIRIFGRKAAAITAGQRAQLMGIAPQSLDGPVPYKVRELVELSRTAWRARWWLPQPASADNRAVEQALSLTDLTGLRDRAVESLSGGERQRVIIAMAIAREPPLLLLDEITAHLDMNHRLEIMRILERLNREQAVTILMISHDMNLSADFCRRLVLLDHGSLAGDGPPETVLREDLLKRVYNCEVTVYRDQVHGTLRVHPVRRPAAGRQATPENHFTP